MGEILTLLLPLLPLLLCSSVLPAEARYSARMQSNMAKLMKQLTVPEALLLDLFNTTCLTCLAVSICIGRCHLRLLPIQHLGL